MPPIRSWIARQYGCVRSTVVYEVLWCAKHCCLCWSLRTRTDFTSYLIHHSYRSIHLYPKYPKRFFILNEVQLPQNFVLLYYFSTSTPTTSPKRGSIMLWLGQLRPGTSPAQASRRPAVAYFIGSQKNLFCVSRVLHRLRIVYGFIWFGRFVNFFGFQIIFRRRILFGLVLHASLG